MVFYSNRSSLHLYFHNIQSFHQVLFFHLHQEDDRQLKIDEQVKIMVSKMSQNFRCAIEKFNSFQNVKKDLFYQEKFSMASAINLFQVKIRKVKSFEESEKMKSQFLVNQHVVWVSEICNQQFAPLYRKSLCLVAVKCNFIDFLKIFLVKKQEKFMRSWIQSQVLQWLYIL